jgi:hypothetical protein
MSRLLAGSVNTSWTSLTNPILAMCLSAAPGRALASSLICSATPRTDYLRVEPSGERDFDTVFATLAQMRAGALVIGNDPFFNSRSEQLAALSVRHAMPTRFGRPCNLLPCKCCASPPPVLNRYWPDNWAASPPRFGRARSRPAFQNR